MVGIIKMETRKITLQLKWKQDLILLTQFLRKIIPEKLIKDLTHETNGYAVFFS